MASKDDVVLPQPREGFEHTAAVQHVCKDNACGSKKPSVLEASDIKTSAKFGELGFMRG